MTFKAPPYNPYDPTIPDYTPETLPMDEVIRQAITAAMLRMRVHLPAQITKVLGNQKVNVQPLLQTRYMNGKVVTLPEIQNVPVQMPVGKNWSIKFPIAVGETGSLLFCDRSLDVWLSGSGQVVDPQDSRLHDISDPVFIPGLLPFSQQTNDTTNDMVLTNGKAVARLEDTGRFSFGNGQNEITDVMDKVLENLDSLYETLISETFTNTMLGPQPFIASTVTALTNLQTAFEALKTKWETLKG